MGFVIINEDRCITCLNTHLWEVVNAFMQNISNRVFSRWYTIANIRFFTLDLEVTQNIAQYPYIMIPMHMQSLTLLLPTILVEMYLQENKVFDLDLGIKVI